MQRTLIKAAGDTHPGLERENNEDRVHYDDELGIFIVIDGIGGQAAGDKAAETAMSRLRARLERPANSDSVEVRIREAITLANNEVLRLSQMNEEWSGMACVMTVAVIEGELVTIGHVGDTRLYKVYKGVLHKITRDHSPVGEREDAGELSELEAMAHPRRNEVYRDVGSERHSPNDEGFIDVMQTRFEPECALLMCSDGLSDLVTSSEMLEIIEEFADSPWEIVKELINAANEAGGKDNISVIFVEGERFAALMPAYRSARDGLKAHREQTFNESASLAQAVGRAETTTTRAAADSPDQMRPSPSEYVDNVRARRALRGFSDGPVSYLSLLASRWAFLIYGILLGIIALSLWQSRIAPGSSLRDDPRSAESAKIISVGAGENASFSNIREAMRTARSGDTVLVMPGEYREPIQLREGINLISQVSRAAVIRLGDQATTSSTVILATGVTHSRLVGFKIVGNEKNPLEVGLRLLDASVEVDDVEISGMDTGVEIDGTSAAILRANYIHDNAGSGVVIRGRATPRLVGNIIADNGKSAANSKPGIDISARAYPTLTGNFITGNGAEGITGVLSSMNDEVLQKNFFGGEGKANAKGKVRVVGPTEP